MKYLFTTLITWFLFTSLGAQNIYYPPQAGNTWQTISHGELGWCPDSVAALIDYAGDNNTKALIVLKDGKMALEHYYGTFTSDSVWYWASAGKSLTAFLVGLAQEQGFLSIEDTSSEYLGQGWTSCTPEQEEKITIRNQLSMNSGLDDQQGNLDCTLSSCLQYLSEPGTRWSYHNAPYTLLDQVMIEATGVPLNNFVFSNLSQTAGISGVYLQIEYNNVFFSKARSMARFGLLCQNKGVWNQDTIMHDQQFFDAMVNPSQDLNKSYGYLWWLNGQESFMLPGFQTVFPGMLMPDAPADVFSGIGKNVQCVMVSPSTGYVVVRMGNPPEGVTSLVPTILPNMLWKKILSLDCLPTALKQNENPLIQIFPNPGTGRYQIQSSKAIRSLQIADVSGKIITEIDHPLAEFELKASPGIYFARLFTNEGYQTTIRLMQQ